ncbi:hypothetical protein BDB00DRAFT_838148 [Zychaea mexicana]|uniref:uncharacterized protein n=1 Tax=Zychaea mexicana TaxID=64656 RepID=UPI0022FF205F|nr:uncharacterized protein BDB00DRAFT_838148 [Zychaea mexicana]KAI9490359.1 hypothetical protein BDB00DRAFT_838148 [Zychaea mexicana]
MLDIEKLKQRPLSVFHIPQELLDALHPVDYDGDRQQQQESQQVDVTAAALENLEIQQHQTAATTTEPGSSDVLTCNTCDLAFSTNDRQDHRKHFSTDWHRYNIKRKLVLKQPPVSLPEFEAMLADLAESISGSESEEEDEEDDDNSSSDSETQNDNTNALLKKQVQQQQKEEALHVSLDAVAQDLSPFEKKYRALSWFQASPALPGSIHFGVYRKLTETLEGLSRLQATRFEQRKRLWTIIMIGGGHFAGAVVDVNKSIRGPHKLDPHEVKMVAHKTFHRYTTRRKQGGAQSANDSSKGAANSAGAQIRRHNEQMLQQEVREVLDQWKQHIQESEHVFVHAPSNNRKLVYGYDDAVLTRHTSETIPFPTKRPTLNEVRRVFIEMSTLKVLEADIEAIQAHRAKVIDKEERARQQLEKSKSGGKQQDMKKSTSGASNSNYNKALPAQVEKLVSLTKQGKEQLVLAHVRKHEDILLSLSRGPILASLFPSSSTATTPKGSNNNNNNYDDDDADEELKRYPTLLHLAAHAGYPALVSVLVRELDADPTIKNDLGKTAYEVAKDKDTRNALRRCMCDLSSRWDWLNEARVPSPLTREAELEQAEKDRVRKEREATRRRKIEEERQKKEEARMLKKKQEQELAKASSSPSSQKKTGPQMLGGPAAAIVAATGNGPSGMNLASMTPEARSRLEREMRARAAEERMRRLQNK